EGDNVIWIPGYWAWDDDSSDFLWVSGTWRAVPPGRQWIPGYFAQVEGGWQWVAGYWSEQQTADLELLPAPPDPIDEAITAAPSADAIYQPGTWMYVQNRYMWRPGFWISFREGWVWVPAHYIWTPAGFVFIDGYWDYPLERRGLLFSPVSIAADYRTRPNWYFQPAYVVLETFLLAALFERPTYAHY